MFAAICASAMMKVSVPTFLNVLYLKGNGADNMKYMVPSFSTMTAPSHPALTSYTNGKTFWATRTYSQLSNGAECRIRSSDDSIIASVSPSVGTRLTIGMNATELIVGGSGGIARYAMDGSSLTNPSGLTYVFNATYSPDGTKLAVSEYEQGTGILVYNVPSMSLLFSIPAAGTYRGISWSPDSSKIVIASDPLGVRLVDVATGTITATVESGRAWRDVVWSSDGTYIAAVSDTVGHNLKIIEPVTWTVSSSVANTGSRIISSSGDSRYIAVSTCPSNFQVYDMVSGSPVAITTPTVDAWSCVFNQVS